MACEKIKFARWTNVDCLIFKFWGSPDLDGEKSFWLLYWGPGVYTWYINLVLLFRKIGSLSWTIWWGSWYVSKYMLMWIPRTAWARVIHNDQWKVRKLCHVKELGQIWRGILIETPFERIACWAINTQAGVRHAQTGAWIEICEIAKRAKQASNA